MKNRKHALIRGINKDEGLPEIPELAVDMSMKMWTVKISFRKGMTKLGEDLTNNALRLIATKGGKVHTVNGIFLEDRTQDGTPPLNDPSNKNNFMVIIKYMGKDNYFQNKNSIL